MTDFLVEPAIDKRRNVAADCLHHLLPTLKCVWLIIYSYVTRKVCVYIPALKCLAHALFDFVS